MNRDRQADALGFGADGDEDVRQLTRAELEQIVTETRSEAKRLALILLDKCDQIRAYCDELLKGDSNKYQLAHRIKRVVDEIAR